MDGRTPLMVLARNNTGDPAARLAELLREPSLDLGAVRGGQTAEAMVREWGRHDLADMIAAEVLFLIRGHTR